MYELINALQQQLGKQSVMTGNDIGERYHADWSGMAKVAPLAVLRPDSTESVSVMIKHCHAHDQKIVIQGGLTGLAGASTPKVNELALSLERLDGIEDIDPDAMTMTVWAGTSLEKVQQAANDAGFLFPLDLGARGSCSVGGNAATNAGGTQVIRYGMVRNLILGMEVVLADGTIMTSLNKMLKNNAGYDLKHLFIGAEGTLGVVTRLVLRLFPLLNSTCTALCAFNEFEHIVKFLRNANARLAGSISSFEVMWADYYNYVIREVDGVRSPFDTDFPLYVVIETEGTDQVYDKERFESFLAGAMDDGLMVDAIIAQSQKDTEDIWGIRHAVSEIIPRLQPLSHMDISIPISEMEAFLEKTRKELLRIFPDIIIIVFGHMGDSNLHYLATTGKKEDNEKVELTVYKIIREFSGSVSAEHGIGVLKKEFLSYSRSSVEIELMRKIKTLLDPKQILNSGRVF